MREFADRHGVVIYLQPKGPDTAFRFHPLSGPKLSYTPAGIRPSELEFKPTEFTQVNHAVNRVLVRRAPAPPSIPGRGAHRRSVLRPGQLPHPPIARLGPPGWRRGAARALVERGRESAAANGLAERVEFGVANLFACTGESLAGLGKFDKMLIDPPEGAIEVAKAPPTKGPSVSSLCLVQPRDPGPGRCRAGQRQGPLKAAGPSICSQTAHVNVESTRFSRSREERSGEWKRRPWGRLNAWPGRLSRVRRKRPSAGSGDRRRRCRCRDRPPGWR